MKKKKPKTMTPREKFEKLKRVKAKGLSRTVSARSKKTNNSSVEMNAGYIPPFQGELEEGR